jgi:hypothetical protein
LLIGVWLWADAIPLDTTSTAAAINAECFLMNLSFAAPPVGQRLPKASVPAVKYSRMRNTAKTDILFHITGSGNPPQASVAESSVGLPPVTKGARCAN